MLYIENNSHWLECAANSISLNQLIQQTTSKFFIKHKIELHNMTALLQQLFQTPNSATNLLRLQGLIPNNLSTTSNINSNTLVTLYHKISNNLYKQIWTERCKAVHKNSLLTNTLTIATPEHPATDQVAVIKYEKWATIFPTTNITTSYIATLNLVEV